MRYITLSVLVSGSMSLVTICWFLNLLGSTADKRANISRLRQVFRHCVLCNFQNLIIFVHDICGYLRQRN